MNYIVIDWANNLMYNGKQFDTFEDGWDYIYRLNPDDESGLDDFYVIRECSYKPN